MSACKTTLDSVHITDFKDIDIDFKGAARILEPLTNALVNHFHKKISKAVETKMFEVLTKEVQKNALCSVAKG